MQVVKDVMPVLRCITDQEAVCMGIFMYETFKQLNHWRTSVRVGGTGACMGCMGMSLEPALQGI